MRRPYHLLPVLLLFLLQAAVLQAQDVRWEERRTLLFSILYPSGAETTVDQYAQFVDGVYDETSALVGYRPIPPIVLRIYPTMDLYYQANPLAARLPGVIAHAHTGRREISVAIPQTIGQSDEEIENNVRHELTHIIAADLSGGRLTTPWQEGISQYVERPSSQLEAKMELMRQIVAENRLLSWSELNQPGATYADPRIGYPQTLTIVAFLIQRNGIERFRAFMETMKDASGYRGALETVYGVPADVLEQEWLAQLPRYISEGYRNPAAAGAGRGPFDLAQPEQMIERGDYSGAIRSLQPLVESMRAAGDQVALLRGQSLLARALAGREATSLASEAHEALGRGDYPTAYASGTKGRAQLEALGLHEQAAAAGEYAALAERGIAAQNQFDEAGTLLRRLQLRPAQQRLTVAYQTFGELGDEARASQARAGLLLIARGEQALAVACLLGGGLLVLWSARRRYGDRQAALPYA